MRFAVEHQPSISALAMLAISAEVDFSSISEDEYWKQYQTELCFEQLEEYNQDGLFDKDLKYLSDLLLDNVDYIEF